MLTADHFSCSSVCLFHHYLHIKFPAHDLFVSFCVAFKCLIMENTHRIRTGGRMRAGMLLFSFFFSSSLAFDLTELDLCYISKNIIIWSLLHAVTHSISGPCVWLRIKTGMYQDACPTGCKSEPVHTFRIRSFSSYRLWDRFGCASFIRQWWSSLICSVFVQIRPNECQPDSQMAYGSSLSCRRISVVLSSDRDSRGGLLCCRLSPNPGNTQCSQI